MTGEELRKRFFAYDRNACRIQYLHWKMEEMDREREAHLCELAEQVAAAPGMEMPPAAGGYRKASPTEHVLLQQEAYEQRCAQERAGLERELAALKREQSLLEILLTVLREKERAVFRLVVMEGRSWQEAAESYEKEYGIPVSIRTLQNWQKSALQRLQEVTGEVA